MIGRELGDPKHIKWMSCANKGMNIRCAALFSYTKENDDSYMIDFFCFIPKRTRNH